MVVASLPQDPPASLGYYPTVEFFRWNFIHPVHTGGKTEYIVVLPRVLWTKVQEYDVSRVNADKAFYIAATHAKGQLDANQTVWQ